MQRLSNAWQLAKASWHVLSQDRELIAVPIIAGAAALVAFLVITIPGVLLTGGSDAQAASDVALWGFIAAGVVVATWITVIGEAAVVAGAAERMEGGDPDMGSALATARSRAIRLLEWALLATVVSAVLDQIEQHLGVVGRVVSWIGGVAFRVMSFLALPIIVFENVGAIEGFKRSSALLKRTWGEQVAFNFGLGLLGLLAVVPALVIGGALLGTGVVALQVVGGVAAAVWIALVFAVTAALSAVFKTALYRFANDLPVDPAFDAHLLSTAFRRR